MTALQFALEENHNNLTRLMTEQKKHRLYSREYMDLSMEISAAVTVQSYLNSGGPVIEWLNQCLHPANGKVYCDYIMLYRDRLQSV